MIILTPMFIIFFNDVGLCKLSLMSLIVLKHTYTQLGCKIYTMYIPQDVQFMKRYVVVRCVPKAC
jgi:hypothetical protein